MKTYFVKWEIEIDADSPREAASKALEIHRNPQSIATVFGVSDKNGNAYQVDLSETPKRQVKPK